MKYFIAGILLMFLPCAQMPATAQEMKLEVITMQHRNADDVVRILGPLVAPGGTVTGMNNQLIIKTTPENMAELRQVLENLDRAPRRLLISVRQDSSGVSGVQEQTWSGKYSSGDVSVKINDPEHAREGLVVSAQDEKGNTVRYHSHDTAGDSTDQSSFRVQATEGHPAFINVGQSLPLSNRTISSTPQGIVINDATEYVDVTSGFYVLPRLNGDQVTLLVAPSLSKATPGKMPVFDIQNVETTATGSLGEWLSIGGINQDLRRDDYKILSSSSRQRQLSNSIQIMVEELK